MTSRTDGKPRADRGVPRKYASVEEQELARKAQRKAAQEKYRNKNKALLSEKARAYHEANKEARSHRATAWQTRNKDRVKNTVYMRKYGISLGRYNDMCDSRGGLCDICKRLRKLVVDHCHTQGTVRGLLCDRCNVAIGCFEDDIARIKAAYTYLSAAFTTTHIEVTNDNRKNA